MCINWRNNDGIGIGLVAAAVVVVMVSSKLGAHYSFRFLHNIYDVNGQHKCNVIYVPLVAVAAAAAAAAVTIDDIYSQNEHFTTDISLSSRWNTRVPSHTSTQFTNYPYILSNEKKIDQISGTSTFPQ